MRGKPGKERKNPGHGRRGGWKRDGMPLTEVRKAIHKIAECLKNKDMQRYGTGDRCRGCE